MGIFERIKQHYGGIGLAAGVAALAGCDTEKVIMLDEITLQGPVRVTLVQKVERGTGDSCYLDVYDSNGKLRARHSVKNCRVSDLPWETRMVHDDGRVYKRVPGGSGYVREQK